MTDQMEMQDKAVQLITDIRDQLVLEMAGMDACRDAPPDV